MVAFKSEYLLSYYTCFYYNPSTIVSGFTGKEGNSFLIVTCLAFWVYPMILVCTILHVTHLIYFIDCCCPILKWCSVAIGDYEFFSIPYTTKGSWIMLDKVGMLVVSTAEYWSSTPGWCIAATIDNALGLWHAPVLILNSLTIEIDGIWGILWSLWLRSWFFLLLGLLRFVSVF